MVLCQPLGAEYFRCHRAFRLLAEELARAGFGALRFDYYGSGDSAGEGSDADLEQWGDDVEAAIEECRTRSGRERVAAVGLRLGASLALLRAQRGSTLDALVLWEPVVSGDQYVAELTSRHREFQRGLPHGGPESAAPNGWAELGGFLYSPRLLQQLAALDLGTASPPVERVLLIEANGHAEGTRGHGRLPVIAQRADRVTTAGPQIWLEDADRALVPRSSLQAIAGWLTGVYA